ncbi:phosphatase PAP2 family protein [Mycolicibacterium sphagni]|uniref:Phosphatase PAP2 family protein n=2 Tax=Mycolicibacterium sphagni TaxID=1786 RepID=A0ABX2JXA3_9MYCO|nr:phosphatase PAP2 family protein [Mycolicibacterium sphagni]
MLIDTLGMTEHTGAPRAAPATTMMAVLISLFVALGFVAHATAAGTTGDHAVLAWMVHHRHPWLTALAITVTNLGSPAGVAVIAIAAAAVAWWRVGSARPALLILTTLVVASTVSTLTKSIVGAHRPARAVQLVVETDRSFPSGHVTGTLALLGVLAVVIGQHARRSACVAMIALAGAATIAVGLTRLYLGVHWATDIAGGLLLGTAAVVGAYLTYRRMMGTSDTAGRASTSAPSPSPPTIGA